MQTQSIGLALTLSLLTGALITLDLTDVRTGSVQRTVFPAASISNSVHALGIMPSSVPGIIHQKADISDGVFAVGSSTGKEGLDEEREGDYQEDDAASAADSPASNADSADSADKASDFVLI